MADAFFLRPNCLLHDIEHATLLMFMLLFRARVFACFIVMSPLVDVPDALLVVSFLSTYQEVTRLEYSL